MTIVLPYALPTLTFIAMPLGGEGVQRAKDHEDHALVPILGTCAASPRPRSASKEVQDVIRCLLRPARY
jgi:hypothetical protein